MVICIPENPIAPGVRNAMLLSKNQPEQLKLEYMRTTWTAAMD